MNLNMYDVSESEIAEILETLNFKQSSHNIKKVEQALQASLDIFREEIIEDAVHAVREDLERMDEEA